MLTVSFSPLVATAGGMLIGASAALMFAAAGRIAGISGIVGGLVSGSAGDRGWRVSFVAGLLLGGLILARWLPDSLGAAADRGLAITVFAGLLVGFGTRLGNGCTSGHGVCGLSRLSARSGLATAVFMASAMLTVALMGGAS